MRAWEATLHAHAALSRALRHELEEHEDIPLSWYEVLLLLNRAPGQRLRMQELADSTLFTPSGVTRQIDGMVEAGLVERVRCQTDKRGFFAALTPAGKERLRAASPAHLRSIQRHFGSQLSDQEADTIAEAMSRITDAITGRCPGA
jgi:DNA-binding MarR family transcriptional regulator